MRATLTLATLAGCWSTPSPPPATAPPRQVETKLASCPVDPPIQTPQALRLVRWLGPVGDRSWVIAERARGAAAVIGLARDGTLLEIPLAAAPHATHVDGTRLWLATPNDKRIALTGLDLAADRPEVVARGTLDAPYVRAIAVGATRVLADVSGPNLQLRLHDRAGAPAGKLVEIVSTSLEPAALSCEGDRCFALAVEGDGPSRRLFVERFAPDGRTEHQQLAGDHLAAYRLAVIDARRFALWTSYSASGVFARELDASGHPLGERTRIFLAPERSTDFEVITSHIAVHMRDGWSVGTFDPRRLRLGALAATGLPRDSSFLTAAPLPDGLVTVGFTSSVDDQHGFHAWSGRVDAAFLGAGDTAEPALRLASGSGAGRGGIAGFPLVAPGHAAVLVLPQGPESPPGGELVTLRRPCR
ncbi:MAG: hypothetical protein KF773_14165 [Deltaproteobacteria bacterium]|nr:hypothetical protein [Deltaproteobacteria bacterium]